MVYIVLNQVYLFLLIFSLTVEAQEELPTKVRLEIDTVAETLIQEANIPRPSIAISKNGAVLCAEGFGYANSEED